MKAEREHATTKGWFSWHWGIYSFNSSRQESGSAFGTVLSGMEALHRILTISAEG